MNRQEIKKVLAELAADIDRRVTIPLDKTQLPDDLKFKGFETRIIQDIKIITDNVEFKLEVYYSPSLITIFYPLFNDR